MLIRNGSGEGANAGKRFGFESIKDYSGYISAASALAGLAVFVVGVLFVRADNPEDLRYWNVYNPLFAAWAILEFIAFGAGVFTVIERTGEPGLARQPLFFAAIAGIMVSVLFAIFLVILLLNYYFGGVV